MKKKYNLSMLFEDAEFAVQRAYIRYSSKETYFLVLHRFTLEAEAILEQCQPEQYFRREIDIETLTRNAERLLGILEDIGAISLTWSVQNLNHLLDKKNYEEYLKEFDGILKNVDSLRKMIINAEVSTKKNILAIENMPDVLQAVGAMLKDKYNIFGINNYESVIGFLSKNVTDLILLDIEMTEFDGFAMVRLLRRFPRYAETPVIFLTKNLLEKHVRTVMSLGACDIIKKPVDVTVLVNRLERALL